MVRIGESIESEPSLPPAPVIRRSVDLERREDRYIIFVRDTGELIEDLAAHTRRLEFPETPVTRTVYFGDSARGLPPGLSIKARTYARDRKPGRWDLGAESPFELLELKRTVDVGRAGLEEIEAALSADKTKKRKRDEFTEILRLSGSILARSTYKSKQRKPRLSLAELLELISDPPSVRDRIAPELYIHLLETVHPLRDFRWRPVIGTEYKRTHFVTREPELTDVFRATLDKRVTHYTFYEEKDRFVGIPLSTEAFSRFEVKADHERIAGTALGDWLEETVVKFRAFRIPSKKYRGMTIRSNYHISRQGFRNESPGQIVYAEFPSTPVRYRDHEHYVNLARYIQSSKAFHLYKDEPILLESHEHSVRARSKGLQVLISGNHLRFERAPRTVQQKPVQISARDAQAVTDLPLTSREDLERIIGEAKLKDQSTHYDRSRSFLVENRKSGRVYKVGLERRHCGGESPEYFVVIEYVGRSRGRPRFDTKPIVKDIAALYRFVAKDPLLTRRAGSE